MGYPNASQLEILEDAFKTFTQVSSDLESSYQSLESRIGQLSDELYQQQACTLHEKAEKDRFAARFVSIIEALPAGVVVLNSAGVIKEYNSAAVEILGIPLHNQVWLDVISNVFAPRSDDGHEISLHNGRRVNLITGPLGNEPGQVLLFTDVTETRDLQKRLSQHQRLTSLGEMAAGIAHQIRTPLSSGLLYISQLKNSTLEDAQRLKIVEKVMAQMRHLENLLNDMLLFSRGSFSGEENVDVAEMLQSAFMVVLPQCETQGVKLEMDIESIGDLKIIGNKTVLSSAFQNLIVNAAQSTEFGGVVQITGALINKQFVDIRVQDNGCGISETSQERIFDPFYTTRSSGIGLGLALVKNICQAHFGDVWLEESNPHGSTFVVRLPLLQSNVAIKLKEVS